LIKQVIEEVERFFKQIYAHPAEVVSIAPNNEGWEVTTEILTDDEYTKKRARNDLIAVFKVLVNRQAEVVSYTREEIRERGKAIKKADN